MKKEGNTVNGLAAYSRTIRAIYFYTKFRILPETNCITFCSLTFISSHSVIILASVTEKVTAMALWEVSD